jgi:hypothetical protein
VPRQPLQQLMSRRRRLRRLPLLPFTLKALPRVARMGVDRTLQMAKQPLLQFPLPLSHRHNPTLNHLTLMTLAWFVCATV